MPKYTSSLDLIKYVSDGKTWAVARLISRAEAGIPEVRAAIGEIYRKAGCAHVVGITGVPGSGKSTLVGKLAKKLREKDKKVAIVAIDPSSPYSGGSILGDRIRMTDLALDPGVFIRSMATRGAVGGMAHAALDVVDILDVAGYDTIIIETVGVGQDEVEIANASHTTVVVSAPGLGDEVQAIKAGILEIADVHIVSKCDRSDANRTLTDLKMMLKDSISCRKPDDWITPVIGISSVTEEGFDTFIEALDAHRANLNGSEGVKKHGAISAFRLRKSAEAMLLEQFRASQNADQYIPRVLTRESDPYSVACTMVQSFKSEISNA